MKKLQKAQQKQHQQHDALTLLFSNKPPADKYMRLTLHPANYTEGTYFNGIVANWDGTETIEHCWATLLFGVPEEGNSLLMNIDIAGNRQIWKWKRINNGLRGIWQGCTTEPVLVERKLKMDRYYNEIVALRAGSPDGFFSRTTHGTILHARQQRSYKPRPFRYPDAGPIKHMWDMLVQKNSRTPYIDTQSMCVNWLQHSNLSKRTGQQCHSNRCGSWLSKFAVVWRIWLQPIVDKIGIETLLC